MERRPLKSSAIVSKGFNAFTKQMEVEFPDGTIGSFQDVTQEDSQWFDEQESAGKALWAFRRSGYSFEKGER